MSAACQNRVPRAQVAREGTKKTVFTNYMELCKAMNRQPEHVQAFLMAELGTSGNLDGQMRLVVKGRFQPKAFEGVLRRYANECALALGPRTPGLRPEGESFFHVSSSPAGGKPRLPRHLLHR